MSSRSRRFGCACGIVLAGLYLLNPTAGIVEFLPDNIPFVGNLDEVGATLLIARCVQGWRRAGRPTGAESS